MTRCYEFVSTARVVQLDERYGEKYGKLIAFRKVDTGTTGEMVVAAWGEPYHKSEVKKEDRTLETWHFPDNRHVELLDGRVRMCVSIEWGATLSVKSTARCVE